MQGIEEMGFSMMTEIQAQTIPHLLEGRDLVGAAKTGAFYNQRIKNPQSLIFNKKKKYLLTIINF